MPKILTKQDLNTYPPKNNNGEWATYLSGVFDGYHMMHSVSTGGIFILLTPEMEIIFNQMVTDAANNGITLTAAKGFVTLDQQIAIRKRYIKKEFKDKVSDLDFLLSSPVTCYSPMVGLPGWSNHQNVRYSAIDFNVTKTDKNGNRIGNLPSYKWLVENASKYNFVRTVPSERWHWEYRAGFDPFFKVPKNHPTWDGLI